MSDSPEEKTVAPGDFSSTDAVSSRLKVMFDEISKKCGTEKGATDLYRACCALIRANGDPNYKELKLQGIKKIYCTNPDGGPTKEELKDMLPLLELAEIAYEPVTRTLEKFLQEHGGYHLIRHDLITVAGGVGHYLAFCPERKVLLIGIKGTSSVEDALTDCVAITIPHDCLPHNPFDGSVSDDQQPFELRAHEGILVAARKMVEDVSPIIEHCFLPLGYTVQIVGHSLGAGTAGLLAVLLRSRIRELRDHPKKLHAWCFASPPVMDLESSQKCKSFVTTICNKSDGVPRASLANGEVLIRVLEKIYDIMDREGQNTFFNKLKGAVSDKDKPEMDTEKFVELMATLDAAVTQVDLLDPSNLFVPGKVISLYESSDGSKITTSAAYVEASHKSLRFLELVNTMISDHFVTGYRETLNACLEKDEEE